MADKRIQGTNDESNLRDICGEHSIIAGNRGVSFPNSETMQITAETGIDRKQYNLGTGTATFTTAIDRYCRHHSLETKYEDKTVQITRK
jgi:hypothetical protein